MDLVSIGRRFRKREKSAYRQESARRRPEFAHAYDALVDRLGRTDWPAGGPQVGERLPEFNLPDANGRIVIVATTCAHSPP